MRGARGFTLVELLVVFAILALVVGLAPVAYGRMKEASDYRNVVRSMFGELRSARSSALTQGRSVRFLVDVQGRRYGVEGQLLHTLPESLQVRVVVADKEVQSGGIASVRFLPGGGATGGSVEVLRATGSGTRLRVDWLSGRVSQEALLP